MKKSEARKQSNIDVSIVIPCYNEADGVRKSLEEIRKALRDTDGVQVIVVNDGSSDETPAILKDCAKEFPQIRVLHNGSNLGYGASLKRGIREAQGEIIVITDADGTYPASSIPELLNELKNCDMAVGARIGSKVEVPLIRRPAKWLLLLYARWMARADIKDLNSGLRCFRRKDAIRFFPLLPDRIRVTDRLDPGIPFKRLSIGSDATSIYVANSLTYQESRLCPWQHADWKNLPVENGKKTWTREYFRGSGHSPYDS